MTRLYSALGVPPSADASLIKRAFRKKAAKTHPDRAGGDKESFQLIQKAYAILSDPERRRLYDQTGDDEALPEDRPARCLNTLAQLVLQTVESASNLEHTDIKAAVVKTIRNGQQGARAGIEQLRGKINRYQTATKRFKSKKDKTLITSMLEAQVKQLQHLIAQAEENIQLGEEMIEILKDYEYEVDAVETTASGGFFMGRIIYQR